MRYRLLLLVGMLGAASSAFGQINTTPDAIYYNGKVVTVDPKFTIEQAFAVKDGEFIGVGSNAKMKALSGKGTRQVDLKGATVIPGLSDNHDHLYNATKYLRQGVDMIGVTTLAEMQSRLRAGVAKAKPGEVVFTTSGWAVRPPPTRKDLDAVSSDVPIVVIGMRRGNGVLNSPALKLAGITKENPTFNGAKLRTDDSGELTGAEPGYPQAVELIDKIIPAWTPAAEEEMIGQGMRQRNALGITSIRELSIWPKTISAYFRLWRQNNLTLRVAVGVEFPDQENTIKNLQEMGIAVPFGDHWMRMDSLSEEPWTPGTMAAAPWMDFAMALNRIGWRPAPHVNGDPARNAGPDEAINNTLDAYEAADRESSIKDKRWYVEHVPFATPQQIDRMAKLGIIVSIQDSGYNPGFPVDLPKERFEHQNPVREFLEHKLVVIGGSDYSGPNPIEKNPNNPMIPFYFYVTRKSRAGAIVAGDEKISREDALRIFTVNPAYATFEEKVKGSIAPGMLADFVILNQDIMTVPDDKLLETHPLATFVGGKKVYSAENTNF